MVTRYLPQYLQIPRLPSWKRHNGNGNIKDRATINHNGKLGALEDKGMLPMALSFLSFFLIRAQDFQAEIPPTI